MVAMSWLAASGFSIPLADRAAIPAAISSALLAAWSRACNDSPRVLAARRRVACSYSRVLRSGMDIRMGSGVVAKRGRSSRDGGRIAIGVSEGAEGVAENLPRLYFTWVSASSSQSQPMAASADSSSWV